MVRTGLVVLFSSVCISLPGVASPVFAAPSQQAPVNPLAQAMVDFKKRVDAYLELRRAIASKLPEVKETGDPAKISDREKALGKAIAMARAKAKAGDVFGPEMSRHLQRILAEDWNSRSAADRKALFEEIPPGLQLKVNQAVSDDDSSGDRASEAAGTAADDSRGARISPRGPPAAAA